MNVAPRLLLQGLLLVAALPAIGHSETRTITHSIRLADNAVPSHANVSVPRFDSSLGHLDRISVAWDARVGGLFGFENVAPGTNVVSLRCSLSALVELENGDDCIYVPAALTSSLPVPAFDGTLDYGGTSGMSAVSTATLHARSILVAPQDRALFMTDASAPDALTTLRVTMARSVTVSRGAVCEWRPRCRASITVTYEYTPAAPGP